MKHREIEFENALKAALCTPAGGYESGTTPFDAARGLFGADVVAFIQSTQTRAWDHLAGILGGATETTLLDTLTRERLSKGALHVLRYGFKCFGKTLRLARGEPVADAPRGPAMIQPYLPTIETEGETSLLFFGGKLSHVVNKRPVPGEFRVQVQYGGGYVALPEPPPGALALAEKTLAAIGEDLLYARIDMAPDTDGGWLLMEAELIEPDFYLGSSPEGGTRFAAAVRARL